MQSNREFENHADFMLKTQLKQLTLAHCLDKLAGNDPLNEQTEVTMTNCINKNLSEYQTTISRFDEMFQQDIPAKSQLI